MYRIDGTMRKKGKKNDSSRGADCGLIANPTRVVAPQSAHNLRQHTRVLLNLDYHDMGTRDWQLPRTVLYTQSWEEDYCTVLYKT